MSNLWEHLFKGGEFAGRGHILGGLTLEQVTRRPSAQSHTIYEELWHTSRWQAIVVNRDEGLYGQWKQGRVYPEAPPAGVEEWEALVAEFHAGTEKALWWTESPERLGRETRPGATMADALHSLAVHTAHHLGKIIALRQFIGAWEPESEG
ncbi:MAG TPA: DinB family protein [Pyrinomonadaceae bacterium]